MMADTENVASTAEDSISFNTGDTSVTAVLTEDNSAGDPLQIGDVENIASTADDSISFDTDDTTVTAAFTQDSCVGNPETEASKERLREIEAEVEKLKEMQNEVKEQMNFSSPTVTATAAIFPSLEEKMEADERSVYVGNVDYGATAEELAQHFNGCGSVKRVTILCDKFSGHPKGHAFVEFEDKDSVVTAMIFDGSLFRGREITMNPKRTNRPGISTTNRGRGGRGRGGRGQGGYGGGYGAGFAGGYGGGFPVRARQGYGHFRGRANYYSPYRKENKNGG